MKIVKDKKLNKLLKSKRSYLLILLLIVAYLFLDDRILNEPMWWVWIKISVAAILIALFLHSRYKKFKEYYIGLLKNLEWIEYLIYSVGLSFAVILLQAVLSIPVYLIVIIQSEKSETEYFSCRITNVVTTGIDKIQYQFKTSKHSNYFNVNGHNRKELIEDYYLEAAVKKSFGDVYVLKSLQLQPGK